MSVSFIVPQFLQHLTGNLKRVEVSGNTAGECLYDAIKQFPRLRERLVDESGCLLEYLEIFINGESAYPGEMEKPVVDGDEIYIANAIIGG